MISVYHFEVLKTSITKVVFFPAFNIAGFVGVCVFVLFQNKGVLLIAIGIGPESEKAENQEVLQQIAGQNVFHVADLQSLDDVVNLICGMYMMTSSR